MPATTLLRNDKSSSGGAGGGSGDDGEGANPGNQSNVADHGVYVSWDGMKELTKTRKTLAMSLRKNYEQAVSRIAVSFDP